MRKIRVSIDNLRRMYSQEYFFLKCMCGSVVNVFKYTEGVGEGVRKEKEGIIDGA